MKFDIKDLEKLADFLDTKADTAAALSKEHEKTNEPTEALRQHKRAESGKRYAWVCREAAKRLTVRAKRSAFSPPSFEELRAHCDEKHAGWPLSDRESWFNHFESVGWVVGANKKMINWHRAAANGYANWLKRNPTRAPEPSAATARATRAQSDPPGWLEWMAQTGRPFKAYKYAPEHVRADFQKRAK